MSKIKEFFVKYFFWMLIGLMVVGVVMSKVTNNENGPDTIEETTAPVLIQ